MFNSRHPDPRRVWKGGSEQHLLTPLPGIPQAPGAPGASSKKLFFVDSFMSLTHFSVKDVQFLIKLPMWPKGSPTGAKESQREPKGRPKGPKEHPKGAQGLPKEPKGTHSWPKGSQRRSKDTQRKPKGKDVYIYIYIKNSRSTAPADVMLWISCKL